LWFHRDLAERGFFSPEFREGIEQYYSNNFGGNVQVIWRPDFYGHRSIITLGASPQFEYERVQNYENLAGHADATTARSENNSINAPVYFEAQYYLTQRFSLLAGAQFVYAQRQFVDDFRQPSVGDQSQRQKFFGFNPKFGAIYEIDSGTQFFANFSRSYQPPTLDNLAHFSEGPGSALVYTPLSAQRTWTAELGTRSERGIVTWELAIYYSRVRDELLELNDANGNDIGTTNVARSAHRGIEASVELELLHSLFVQSKKGAARDRLTFEQTYTLNDFHFDGDKVYRDNRIAGIPVHVYEMQLLYEMPGGFYAGPNLRCNLTNYPVDQANSLNADSYALLGFKAGYRAKKGWSVFAEAKNLTNERYAASVDAIGDARTEDDGRVFHPGDLRSFYSGFSWAW